MRRRVGLTGGIGSGKSTVASRLLTLGAVIIDADVLARQVVAPGSAGLAQVVSRFGPQVLRPDGSLDRAALGELVFGDPRALADLNAITHPLVRELGQQREDAAAADAVVVHDIPLLVENDLAGGFDDVVVVEAPIQLRLERLLTRGMSADQARERMAHQASDERRRAVATVVLDNGGTVAELLEQVDALWDRLAG